MFDFKYFTPTKVIFGKNTESKVAELIKEFGGTKILIHYGGGSVVRSGLLKRVTDDTPSSIMDQYFGSAKLLDEFSSFALSILSENNFRGCVIFKIKHKILLLPS